MNNLRVSQRHRSGLRWIRGCMGRKLGSRGREAEGEKGGDGLVEREVEPGCSSTWGDYLGMGFSTR